MIETERLRLIPLTYDQLIKYLKCDFSLEEELNLTKIPRTISPELLEAFEETILPKVADNTKNYLYSTLWMAITKEDNTMVGDVCIVGEPNSKGEIEIGYGTNDGFRNRGFMTEMVGGIIEWAKTEPKVKSITAASEFTNKASCRVLEKNRFVQITASDTTIFWRLKLEKNA